MTNKILGYYAASEQLTPNEIIKYSAEAENCGFHQVMVSDHFQPWVSSQGQASFIWSVLGALGREISLPFSTGVTTAGYRYHPAILAQAAATLEVMFPGRFSLGLGIGEALNEHILGQYWPEAQERVKDLLEAVGIIKRLLNGEKVRYSSERFKLENVSLYTLPPKPCKIFIATSGPYLSKKTGELCDGILTVGASEDKMRNILSQFNKGAELQKDPIFTLNRMLQLHVSWDVTYEKALDNALKMWPNGGMNFAKGDIRYPEVFESLAASVKEEDFANRVTISNKAQDHIKLLKDSYSMGFDSIFVHNCGKNQSEFLRFYANEVIPQL